MWKGLVILINVFLLLEVHQAKGECIVEGIDLNAPTYRNKVVNDTERIQFGRFQTKNVLSVTAEGTPETKYFNVTLNSNKTLIITPTKAFENYGDNETHATTPLITTYLNFICTDDITIIQFIQPVKSAFNRPPYFAKSKYILDVPNFVQKGTDLNKLLDEPVLGCDNDVSNTRLWFFWESSPRLPVNMKNPYVQSKKCVQPIFEVLQNLTLTEYVIVTLSITDQTDLSGKASLMLRPSGSNPQPPNPPNPPLPQSPSFENSTYNASYTCCNNVHDVKFNEVIRIQPGFNISNTSLIGAYANHFSATPYGNEVQIKLIRNLYDDVLRNLTALNLTLTASVKNSNSSATAKLIINLPSNACGQNFSTPVIIRVRNSYQELVDRNLGFTLLINEIQVNSTSKEVIVVIPVHDPVHVYGLENFPWATINVKTVERPGNLTEVRFLYYIGPWNFKQLLLA